VHSSSVDAPWKAAARAAADDGEIINTRISEKKVENLCWSVQCSSNMNLKVSESFLIFFQFHFLFK